MASSSTNPPIETGRHLHHLEGAHGAVCEQLGRLISFYGFPEFMADYKRLIIVEENGFSNRLTRYNLCNDANNVIGI